MMRRHGRAQLAPRARLLMEALLKFALGVALVAALLFGAAGSVYYMQGWLLIAVLFAPMLVAGLVMFTRSPDLLSSRLNASSMGTETMNTESAGV